MNKLSLLLIPAILFIFSCKKDSFITSSNAQIGFSSDSLFFDTVFTTTGSVTQSIKVFNLNDQKINLSDIKLAGGINSPFKINIDGASGPDAGNIELNANDSLYIFISVKIDPTATNLPFLLYDSIQVSFNGNKRYIQLQAWGQNAHFLKNQIISGNVVWSNDLPYVISGSLLVDTNAILTIEKGCKIYFHANAPFEVDGTLQVQGEKDDNARVYFLSDRLDNPYNGYPGSWPGIYFGTESVNNTLEYAVIKNAYQGIVAEGPSRDVNPKLILNECIIDNIYDAGILGVQTNIQARNCLISNCGRNIIIGYGGNYNFSYCTAVSYSNEYVQHKLPVLTLANYIDQGTGSLSAGLTANFTNCIFWGDGGNVDDEVTVFQKGDSLFNVNFFNSLWKIKNNPVGVNTSSIIQNQDPLFTEINNQKRSYDFHLKAGSPAIDAGKDLGITFDLDGNPRPISQSDLGCYER
ncbi:MAG: hypothetical protein JST75_18305 [Bacteroidetes bacterium]|nr:hypothetical protein [Bacteroidota bacterium]